MALDDDRDQPTSDPATSAPEGADDAAAEADEADDADDDAPKTSAPEIREADDGGETKGKAAEASDSASDEPGEPAVEPPPGPPRARRLWSVAILAVILLALDLVTQQWAWDHLREGDTRTLVDGWVYLEFGFNTGSAFSLLRDASWSRMLFIGITVLALLYHTEGDHSHELLA